MRFRDQGPVGSYRPHAAGPRRWACLPNPPSASRSKASVACRNWSTVSEWDDEQKAVRGQRRTRRLPDLGQQEAPRWGDLYQLCPDELLGELNGKARYEQITALLKRHRAQKR